MGFQAEAAMESVYQTPRPVSQHCTGTTQRSSPNWASIGRNQLCQKQAFVLQIDSSGATAY
jgi:hypothetical protein